ncbi:hypothetical protein KKE45_01970 [Patescibacteria group bacterium]|nr:hypothetical protein [Patescibacteria group bacterium]
MVVIRPNESGLRGGSCRPREWVEIEKVMVVRRNAIFLENIVMERERLRSCKRWRSGAIEGDGTCGDNGPLCKPESVRVRMALG